MVLGHMDFSLRKLRRGRSVRRLIALICLFAPILVLMILVNSGIPLVELNNNNKESDRVSMPGKRLEERGLGKLGEMMVEMLPDDLAFTIFVPSEAVFGRVLRLQSNNSLVKQKVNDTFSVLSRLMGFSTVPQHVPSGAVLMHKEISFDSVSGFKLYAWKSSDGILVVNNVRSELVDLRKGEIIIHVMCGVIMDAEFEQSFAPDYED